MSLGCFECKRIGSFNTLIIFSEDGNFDLGKPTSHYSNFYTDCAAFGDFEEVEKSRFMIIEDKEFQSSWNTGTDGSRLRETEYKLVDEKVLAKKLPKIFAALLEKAQHVPA